MGIAAESVKLEQRELTQPGRDLSCRGFEIQNGLIVTCHGVGLKNILLAGTQWLELHINHVNRLNIFPVPDGDTGTNMVLTMRAVLQEVDKVLDHQVETVAAAAAQGAFLGARGNSGLILSQFLSGLAAGLKGKASFTAPDFAAAVRSGAACAYQSVINPIEGTILTVARAVAAACQKNNANQNLATLFAVMVEAGRKAQASTPELLPVLKEAGVTDSGGQGLLYILEGALRFIQGQVVVDHHLADLNFAHDPRPVFNPLPGVEKRSYGYDVQFLVHGQELDIKKIRPFIDAMGDSTLVVGDGQLVKVHVHVEDPNLPLNYGMRLGLITDILVEDMNVQVEAFVKREITTSGADPEVAGGRIAPNTRLVSMAPGRGLSDIFQSLGCDKVILHEGQLTPGNIRALQNIFNQIEARHIIVLPNEGHIIAALQGGQPLLEPRIVVAPTGTIPQGLAASMAYDRQLDLNSNLQRMTSAMQQIKTIELFQALHHHQVNGVHIEAGDVVGLFDDERLEVGADYGQVLLNLLAQINIPEYELITIYYGQDSSRGQADRLSETIREKFPELEIEIYYGGQPHRHYIISLE
jgi:hypothetical protein